MPRVTHVKAARPSKKERRCSSCNTRIEVGDPYMWWKRKTGPASGYTIVRCHRDSCRPRPSEIVTNQYASMIMAAQEDFDDASGGFESPADVAEAMRTYAETAREIGDTMTQNAENMESGFGHATYTSDELRERGDAWTAFADEIDSAASEVENMSSDDEPVCSVCSEEEDADAHTADDGHEFEAEEDTTLEDAMQAAQDAMDNTPE